MSWIVYRKATQDDYDVLNDKAAAFIKRHAENYDWFAAAIEDERRSEPAAGDYAVLDTVLHADYAVPYHRRDEQTYLRNLWYRIFRRATGCADCTGIAWDTIGRSE